MLEYYRAIFLCLLLLTPIYTCCSEAVSLDSIAGGGGERRCLSNGTLFDADNPLQKLASTKCELCTITHSPQEQNQNASRITVIVSPWMNVSSADIFHPTLNLVGSLITRGHLVALIHLYDPSCATARSTQLANELLADRILRFLPCDLKVAAEHPIVTGRAVAVENLNLCEQYGPDELAQIKDTGPYDGYLHLIEPILTTLRKVADHQERPHLVVADAANVAAVLWAEKTRLPVLLIATPKHMDLILERRNTYKGLRQFITRRLKTLWIGFSFARLNVIRRLMGLSLYRMPSDYYEYTFGALYDQRRPPYLPDHVYPVGPTIPQCVKCLRKPPKKAFMEYTSILIMPLNVGLLEKRAIVRGISLARASITQQYQESCTTLLEGIDDLDPRLEEYCEKYRQLSNLRAVWLLDGVPTVRYMPEMFPDFFEMEDNNFADALARYPNTKVIISQCNSDAMFADALGLSVLCLPKRDRGQVENMAGVMEARCQDVRKALVHVLIRTKSPTEAGTKDMTRSVDVVETMAYLTRTNKAITTQEVRARVREELVFVPNAEEEASPLSFTLLRWLAWGYLIISIVHAALFLYLVDEPSKLPAFKRRFKFISGLFHDMYPALLALQGWLSDEKSLHNLLFGTSTAPSTRTATGSDSKTRQRRDSSHHYHSSRRKKASKKR